MISRFSVKKAYTVLVGVVLAIVLGVVAFTKMSMDLLPEMSLPYVVVMTTYVGASPETVEMVVTKPVESSMATVSNIENIQSISNENYSVVILEFSQSADMNAATLDIREKLDQIKPYWDDSVGAPIIMKLNPDMLPIMIAAVGYEGMDRAEISELTNNKIIPEIESIEGVASAKASGLLEERVNVVIRQEKLDEVNARIFAAIEDKFEDAYDEVNDGQKEIDKGWNEIYKGEKELNDSVKKLQDAIKEIEDGKRELEKSERDLANGKNELANAKEEAIKKIQEGIKTAYDKKRELQEQLNQAKNGKKQIEDAVAAQGTTIATMRAGLAAYNSILDANPLDLTDPTTLGTVMTFLGYDPTNPADQMAFGMAYGTATSDEIKTAIRNTDNYKLISSTITTYDQVCAAIPLLEDAIPKADVAIDEALLTSLAEGEIEAATGFGSADAMIKYGEAQIEAAKKQLDSSYDQIDSGYDQIDAAKEQLSDARKQLEDAQKQLDDAVEQIEEQLEQAKNGADINNILTVDNVSQLLMAQNFSMPGGYVTEEGVSYLIRIGDKPSTTEEMAAMPLINLNLDSINTIYLSDVADVFVTNNADDIYTNVNGSAGVIINMQKQTGYSSGDVSDLIGEKFKKLEQEDPNLSLVPLMDQGIYIDLVMDSIINNVLWGGLLAILILLVFLRDLKPTIVIAVSIPVSVISAIACMYFSGVTINVISLSGLSLGIGMLVDNSIVVIENIYRLRSEGKSAVEAAIDGASQVAGAIAASTLTTVCVFAPIVFTEGITRQIFVDMGLTIAYSLLASLVIALTVVPAMASKVLTKAETKGELKFITWLTNGYSKLLKILVRFKFFTLLAAAFLFVASIYLAVQRGTAFMPQMDSTQLTVTLTLPDDALLKDTATVTDEVVNRICEIEDVEDVGAMLSSSSGMGSLIGMSGSDVNQTAIYVVLKENKSHTAAEVGKIIEDKISDLENVEVSVNSDAFDMSALSGSGISIQVRGRDIDKMQEIAKEVASRLEKVEGTAEVSDGMEKSNSELRILVNRDKSMEYGLTVAQVFTQINAKIADSKSTNVLTTDTKEYDVYVINQAFEEMSREDIKNLMIDYTDKDKNAKKVALKDIATFEEKEGLSAINREKQTRYIAVTAQIADGYNVGLVTSDAEKALSDMEIPSGYSIVFSGENEMIMDALKQVLLMMVLALIFMYLIMVAQFQSLKNPFIIMFTVPLAFTGGFLGLWISGSEVSVIAMVGFVMLAGIIVNNGIVIVDYINQLREGGMSKKEAIYEAGRTRLRPVLMTALTTILALSTMAFSKGMGADMSKPMAVVTIGGLIYGTLLTLFVVPCVYDLFNKEKRKKKVKKVVDDSDIQNIE